MTDSVISRAAAHIEEGNSLRARQQWGEAINAYMECVHALDGFVSDDSELMQEAFRLRENATTAIEFIYDITGFVNVDLMNP